METSSVQSVKLAIIAATGLSKDALHIYVGLAVFLAVATVLRKPLRSIIPWFVVVAIAIIGEGSDMRDNIASLESWSWRASLHDLLNTIFWPTALMLFAKFGFWGGASNDRNA